jgi:acetate---CoA ligase (ADP-forming)
MSAQPDEPEPLVRDVLIRDGSALRLQAPSPTDFDDIKRFFDELSAESRYLRFHGAGASEIAARAAVQAQGDDRVTLIARFGGRVVAVAGFEGLREPRVAEVAFAVADDFQNRGVGTRMLEQLAEIAAERGIQRFDAEVLFGNGAMLRVFEDAGFAVRRASSFGEVSVSLDITPSEAVWERIDERDHVSAVASLRPLLAPSSIAVVGAAEAPGNVGRAVLANITADHFEGLATPVNRDGNVVCSRPAARSLAELGVTPDLVIIAATGDELLEFAEEAAASGARALLMVPGDLNDDGGRSVVREERLLEIARGSGMRIVGPSSLGVINTAPEVCMNATFSPARVRPGRLAIGAQAAAPGLGLLAHAQARGMGISVLVSVGGHADVSSNDLLEWCEADERTAVVMLYVESFANPERFTRVARRVSRHKPILMVKGRRSAERARSNVRSRTGAALRGDAVVDAVLHQAGVLRFHSSEEVFHIAQLFESQPLPTGPRIAIVSNSASLATLAADACATHRLEVTDARGAPYPVLLGLGAGAREYAAQVGELLANAAIDAVMVCYVDRLDGDPQGVLEASSAAAAGQSKPVVASVVCGDGRLAARQGGIPNYLFPETCVAVLARAAERRAWLSRPLGVRPDYTDVDASAARAVISQALDRLPGGGWLSPREAQALLATYGISVAASYRCRDLESALAVATDIAGPVTLNADIAAPQRAGEIDAVLLGLEGEATLRSGWHELERRVQGAGGQWTGVIIQRLVSPGADVLLGAFTDPDLGRVVAVGPGGQQAGLADTITVRLPPVTDVDADELIASCPAVADELDRFRGPAALDRQALRELILRFALLLGEVPEVVEADLNPIRCTTDTSLVLDTQMRIEPRHPVKRVKTW